MRRNRRHVVLAFYSAADEGEALNAVRVLHTAGQEARLYSGKQPDEPAGNTGYGNFRLNHESLLVALMPVEAVNTVQRLQNIGSQAIFVLRGDADPTAPPAAPSPDSKTRADSRHSILLRLQEDEAGVESALIELIESVRLGHAVTAAAEWFLDNAYLIRAQIAEVRRHIPRHYARILSATRADEPDVFSLAEQFATANDYVVDAGKIENYLRDVQTRRQLTIGELWLFPLLLRTAIIDGLAVIAHRVSRAQQFREAAYLWANRLASAMMTEPDAFSRMLESLEAEPYVLEPGFVGALTEQLQEEENALAPLQQWYEKRLQSPLPDLVRLEHYREATERVSTANAFTSLRTLSRVEFNRIFESVSLAEAELKNDPAGIHGASNFATRDRARRQIERISRLSGVSEHEVTRRALELASQAGSGGTMRFLLAEGLAQLEHTVAARVPPGTRILRSLRRHATGWYVLAVSALTASFVGLSLARAWEAGMTQDPLLIILGALALLPLSELSIQIVNAMVISMIPPEPLPRLDFEKGIPPEYATLVVIPMMLSSVSVVRREIEKLEVRFLANREENLSFSLFSDFVDAEEAETPEDAELLQAATQGIEDLNARYPGARFLLFHRPRTWSASEQKWIGRERKRGKIHDLNEYLADPSTRAANNILITGELHHPVQFVITLDADTQLPAGAACKMIETIAHPLNRMELDPVTGVRRRGYTIIQPRVSIALPDATVSRFTRIFADTAGTDPYCQLVSDAHQDLFSEAIFHGKAIYDLHAFRTILGNRFPDETLLSHDLIEGAHTGVGLASDIELFENLPLDYSSFSRRQHRWIRGDWQIASWIWRRVPAPDGGRVPNPLSPLNRFRIFDNLRRSLVPVASVLLLLFGWFISRAPGVWSLVVGLAIVIPTLAPLLDRVARRLQGSVRGWRGATDELARAIVMIAFLPHQAWLSVDAIARVVYRRVVSRRRLLEWHTAEHTTATAHQHGADLLRQMTVISGASILLLIALGAERVLAVTSVFPILWALSPLLAHWLGRPAPLPQTAFTGNETFFLRRLARQTWRFFDDLLGPETNWLPPDNTQLALRVEVAQRTSPTNIGLWLTSAAAAFDMGYLTAPGFVQRCSLTLETLERMERYEGHFLNWYDTRTLLPLNPRYVSTVDSGNLLASFWVFARAAGDIAEAPLLGHPMLRGLTDVLSILRESGGSDPSIAMPIHALWRLLRSKVKGYALINRIRMAQEPTRQLMSSRRWESGLHADEAYWAKRFSAELGEWTSLLDNYLRWMETLTHLPDSLLQLTADNAVEHRRQALAEIPSLRTLAAGVPDGLRKILALRGQPGLRQEIVEWLDLLENEYRSASTNAAATLAELDKMIARSNRLADAIDMRILYDAQRRLFGVGYSVGGPLEFSSHYDLLASECRLASLAAIAKGDVPVEHWFVLGRPRAWLSGGQALLSWSGTMFEFLMPLLFMRTYTNSLLEQACMQAVRQQIKYGKDKDAPWGVSESAYSALDAHQIYQYRAFGIPSLALDSTLGDCQVVAPYATFLALMVEPDAAIDNLRHLKNLNMNGPMGMYESIDYTVENAKDGRRGVRIEAYMAHHQGMTLISLDNILHQNVMQSRFHRDLRIKAVESLLFEKVPLERPEAAAVEIPLRPVRQVADGEATDRVLKEQSAIPRVHLQGNGRYSIMLTNSGGGYNRWNDMDITRWRSDTAQDSHGSFILVRDLKTQLVWSTTCQPMGQAIDAASVRFSADRAEYRRRVSGIETLLEVTVAPDDDAEVRRLTVTNHSVRTKELEFTSYLELALAPPKVDAAHPAFSRMFIETECPEPGILLARRRLRSHDDKPVWVAHVLVAPPGPIEFETSRLRFLGRTTSLRHAEAFRQSLSGTTGVVLDPVFSLRCSLTVEPRDRVELDFVTMAADSRETVLAMAAKYRATESVRRVFELSWTRAQLEFRYLSIGSSAVHRFQELAGHLLYRNSRLRAPLDRLLRNRLGQSSLWAHGISGDLPIITVLAADARHTALVREVLIAHTYWRLRGLVVDLVILNQEHAQYERPFRNQLQRQIEAHSTETGTDRPGGVFLRDWENMPEEDRTLLLSTSAVVLNGSRGSLQQQLATTSAAPIAPPAATYVETRQERSSPLPFLELDLFNGVGGFTADAKEYAIYLGSHATTPMPWANVMANRNFGTLVTESGLGYTWHGNSQMNRLTPWHNDPVADPQSEVLYLRDEQTGAVWTPTPLPIREDGAYRARHGQGYTVFEHNSHGLRQELTVFVPMGSDDTVKIGRLRLFNESGHPRKISATYYAEWVLGSIREDQQQFIRTSRDDASGAVTASQYWSGTYAGNVAFAAMHPRAASWSGDRTSFLGRNGSPSDPAGLGPARLDNRTGAALDPAAALQTSIAIDAGQSGEVFFLLGEARDIDTVRGLVAKYSGAAQVETSFNETCEWWNTRLSVVQVKTPLESVNKLLNRWVPYQVLSCRFWGRSAVYQSSGAFGFRDQLQDSMALLYATPELTRAHILTCAARQFPEGDVQHWWHRETGMGVRTRCSDDLLWLPWVVAAYVNTTADTGVLDELVPFLEGPQLAPTEHEHMFTPAMAERREPLWKHCLAAIDRASTRGAHGIPLIGNGDWNDGMNLVGAEGKGESVWLAWFLIAVIRAASPLIERYDSSATARWAAFAREMAAATEANCWDGDWYLRGFFDNGAPLGSHANAEAQIDSLPQSWAVISGAADPARARHALESADLKLADPVARIVKLFTPPFDHSEPHPGYIMGYPPGLRENGGQYTHGSLWLPLAWARLGNGAEAVRLLQMMNPLEHTSTEEGLAHYRAEPYVVSADVYSAAGLEGQAGWTWYTGSAGWTYRVWLEEILGFHLNGERLTVQPAIPDDWPGFEIVYRYRSAVYEISAVRNDQDRVTDVDGEAIQDSVIHLRDDGRTHKVTVWLHSVRETPEGQLVA